ncbi:alpha/beta fold hydrolase [Nocardia tengchongensis]|uniref:alpha/beta fold hydrolase n=1 Tax=Nocardia tengchongensis TaxID=2055889 RepID=UPI00360D3550
MAIKDSNIDTVLGTLRVRVTGSGDDTIVMWPSLLMDHSLWDAQVAHFSTRYTTIAVDPPGHGASSRLTRLFSLDECADCVVQVLDACDVARTHFIGNSWGAMVGATLAARHPDRVRCSVLMNGTASVASRSQRIRFDALLVMARILRGIHPPLTGAVVKAFLGPTSIATRPEVVRYVIATARANDITSVAPAVRSVVCQREDQRQLLKSVRTPTLVIAGQQDATFPPAETAEMAAAIPGAEYVLLHDAAHLAALEVPDVVNSLIDDFLHRHSVDG